ncbi:hypothetical protein M2272_004653 [Mycobacterium frederiksbergense]|uniref:Uncharacterized protein n=1 Tax=Mycolicibacterium frederiksbergense TaxID=117567 RepID=A0ABT6L4X6_9MYCO|nr:hypothetical protein [Mycolicibacterium frederiksbergense]MDH6197997.1 hypothetical protein [Mycolicibacterium frederiksbergense]
MSQTISHRLHILEAPEWKDGVITLLEPRSPYQPWRYAFGESRPGDYAILLLGTDPVSVLTVPARIDHEGGLGGAVVTPDSADLVDLTTLAMLLDLKGAFANWRLDDDEAERVILALHLSPVYGDPFYRWGHSSVVAARNLLRFGGDCHGCGTAIDLSEADARDRVHIHTADPLPRPAPDSPIRTPDSPPARGPFRASMRSSARDWPAILCLRCRDRMRDGNFRSFIDFQFAQNPDCPCCGGQRTQTIQYGMPADPEFWGPWLHIGGCCRRDEKWRCTVCDHEWA